MSRLSLGLAAGLLAVLTLAGPHDLAAQQPKGQDKQDKKDKKQPDKQKTPEKQKTTPEKKPEPEKKAEPEPTPPEEPEVVAPGLPSPLELVRGLREQGMSDLAMELIKDLE